VPERSRQFKLTNIVKTAGFNLAARCGDALFRPIQSTMAFLERFRRGGGGSKAALDAELEAGRIVTGEAKSIRTTRAWPYGKSLPY